MIEASVLLRKICAQVFGLLLFDTESLQSV